MAETAPMAAARTGRTVDAAEAPAILWLGSVPYGEALATQQERVRQRIAGEVADAVLLLEHPSVVTLGRSTDPANLRRTEDELRAEGTEVFEVGRGGDVTYHAPGQLVGYPILDLDAADRKDVHDHLRRIEAALMSGLEALGVPACRVPGRTGVFVDRARSARRTGPDRKIASIGVGVRKWVTFHGFALNVSIDLAGFDVIVPCGLHDVEMTSVARERAIEGHGIAEGDASLDAQVRDVVGESLANWLRTGAPQVL